MTQDQKRVAEKIHKLTLKAQSTDSAEEAAIFAAKAQELLAAYELTLSEVERIALEADDPMGKTIVDYSDTWVKIDDPTTPRGYRYEKKPAPYGGKLASRKRRNWQEELGRRVARSFGVEYLYHSGATSYTLVGRESSRKIAEAVITQLLLTQHDLCEREYRKAAYKRGFKASFRQGFRRAITNRLAAAKREREEKLREEHGDEKGMALAVRSGESLQRSRSWMNANMRTSNGPALNGHRGGNSAGYSSGERHGSKASLNGGVGSGRHGQPLRIGGGA